MKTQVTHSTPTTLGPFLGLVLTLTGQSVAKPVQNLQSPAAEVGDQRQVSGTVSHVFTRAMTLGPFLTLLLTLHNHSSWIERDWWQNSTAPRGAILAARYVSR